MNANEYDANDGDLQKAFQEFMLTGGKGEAVNVALSPTATPSSFSAQEERQKKQRRSIYKRHESALQDFHQVLIRDWLHVDDQLGRVVDSIANLRHRIQLSNVRLVRMKRQQQEQWMKESGTLSKTMSSWKSYAYRGSIASSMTCQKPQQQRQQQQQQIDDLELALSHSLLMHENMMATLRKPLLPLFHDAQEILGRRLQDFMAVVEDSCADLIQYSAVAATDDEDYDIDDNQERNDDFEWMIRMQTDLQQCQDLYRALAEEVYRKQELIQVSILDTVHDGLLVMQNDTSIDNMTKMTTSTNHPQASADWCSTQWSRQGKASALYKFQDLLDRIQEQHQQQQDD